jgi:hypothetical protein
MGPCLCDADLAVVAAATVGVYGDRSCPLTAVGEDDAERDSHPVLLRIYPSTQTCGMRRLAVGGGPCRRRVGV